MYIVVCENDFLGEFYLTEESYFDYDRYKAAQYSYTEACNIARNFNINAILTYNDSTRYYVEEY